MAYPPKLTRLEEEFIVINVEHYALSHGLAVRSKETSRRTSDDASNEPDARDIPTASPAPVTLFPSPWPRKLWTEALQLQRACNHLYAAIAQDVGWLGEVMKQLVEVDDFIARLWNIHLVMEREGYVQRSSLGIFRSDYMLHQNPNAPQTPPILRQVEFNTVASSFAGLASKVSALHRRLAADTVYPASALAYMNANTLPINDSNDLLAWGLAAAHESYESSTYPARPLCLLFVVQDAENNVFDQLSVIEAFRKSAQTSRVFRIVPKDVLAQTRLDETSDKRPLLFRPPHLPDVEYEVSVVYFRALYSPAEFSSDTIWTTRLQIERSGAIKCPSILCHLAGSKKIQQILATPGSQHLERYLQGTEFEGQCDRIRASFAAIYPLDDSEAGLEAIAIAEDEQRCVNYVLKPQREGGGNNIYGHQISRFLKNTLRHDRAKYRGYILMELIEPPAVHNAILRDGVSADGPVIGELGVYGTCLWDSSPDSPSVPVIRQNQEAGFLLRTKFQGSHEGGVAAGFGSVDSPCLVDTFDASIKPGLEIVSSHYGDQGSS